MTNAANEFLNHPGLRRIPKPTSGPLLEFDLELEIELLNAEPWQAEHTSKTLAKYPDLRLVLIAMKPGARLHSHRAKGTILVRTLAGAINLHTLGTTVEVREGRLVTLDSMIPHEVESLTTTYLLLTIAWSDCEKAFSVMPSARDQLHRQTGEHLAAAV